MVVLMKMKHADTKLLVLNQLNNELTSIRKKIVSSETKNRNLISRLHQEFKKSGVNFLHYLSLRSLNLKDIQLELVRYGLSSLGRSESYVMNNIDEVLARISDSLRVHQKQGLKSSIKNPPVALLDWFEAEKILHRHTQDLFGKKPHSRHVYIMVTAPSRSEFTQDWVRKIMKSGANLIRINCAHDCAEDWLEMVTMIRQSEKDMNQSCRILMDLGGPKIRTVMSFKKKLSKGSLFYLVDKSSNAKKQILCSFPNILKFVNLNERVLFDDGKIETKVVRKLKNKLLLEVISVPAAETKLKTEKGINFPDSRLKVSEVTEKDLQDLDFISQHADLVGLSFVQSTTSIRKIRQELKKRTSRQLGIIMKIETQLGFESLPQLLFEAMRDYPCGVMIARGDLGVEVGFERMVEVQEEILWLSEAAHVPVIWATQVLEGSAKLGQPSRAEVTDAAAAVRAECVMLNKGPFIENAVRSLDNILKRMEFHTYKKRNLYRELSVAKLSPSQIYE